MNKNIWECDRCHKQISVKDVYQIKYFGDTMWEVQADLCKNCIKDFHKKFMKMKQ